jgi:hypothetical protein
LGVVQLSSLGVIATRFDFMSEFENMDDVEARLLTLEALALNSKADFLALQSVVLGYLKSQEAKCQDGTSIGSAIERGRIEFLRETLADLADENADRASKISRLLNNPKP